MEKVWRDAKDLLEEEIKKIVKKGDISAAELANLEKAICLVDKIEDRIGPDEGGASYGMHSRMPYSRMMYGEEPMYSGRRGRSPVTGRYVSRGMDPAYEGYSGHSINDRMVAKLEEMYDSAKTEHEREVVDKWIKRLETER